MRYLNRWHSTKINKVTHVLATPPPPPPSRPRHYAAIVICPLKLIMSPKSLHDLWYIAIKLPDFK